MEQKYWFLLIGVGIGWITKVPFLLKWYRELRKTKMYQAMNNAVHAEEIRRRYNELFPDNPIKK